MIWECAGAADAVVCEHHALGGAGAAKLGEAVIAACNQPVDFNFLYDLKQPIKVLVQLSAISPGDVATTACWHQQHCKLKL